VPECTESQAAAHSNNQLYQSMIANADNAIAGQVICYIYYYIFMHHIKRLPIYIH
jgi:hypothetical protein